MKTGKLSENVLKRSILKQIKNRRPEVLVGAAVGEDCAVVALEEDEVFVLSTDPITGTTKDIGSLSVHTALNDIASEGAEPVGVLLSCMLPPETEESEIRAIMKQVEETCEFLNVEAMGGHTEITKAVNQPILTVTGVGKAKRDQLLRSGGVRQGDDIIATKWIGLEGTSIIAKEREKELLERFAPDFVSTAKDFDKYISVVPEAAVAIKSGAHAMHDVTEGGIFGALWEIAESSGVGLEIDLKAIPIRQETVEVCNYYDVNPYILISGGCMLIAAPDGFGLVRELEKKGINAAVIGKATDSNDRVVENNGERRFLTPPETDELYKFM